MSFIPAVAALVLIEVNGFLAAAGRSAADLGSEGTAAFRHLLVLGNGFIVTALFWGWALASIIDGRLGRAAAVFAACAVATLFGLIHSPLPSGALFWPWSAVGSGPLALASAYGVGVGLLLALARMREER